VSKVTARIGGDRDAVVDGMPPAGPPVEVERIDLAGTNCTAAILWLNRPEAMNAISAEMIAAFDAAIDDVEGDQRVCTVLITGRGSAFSAGGDMKAYLELQKDAARWTAFMDSIGAAFGRLHYLSKPVVALLNGYTIAGGIELLVACDFAYAARSAKIGDGHLRYGQMGGAGVLAHLPRLIGPARARELLFTSNLLSAEEALDWGLVNRVVEDDELIAAGLAFAAGIAEKSPAAVASLKYAVNAGFADGTGLHSALRLERERAALYLLSLPDSMEGITAFAEKRKPRFPGR
jgi:enoyl-CoA hydratase/carnithine racemase